MENEVSGIVSPIIERVKINLTDKMENGEKIKNNYSVKFISLELYPYNDESIKEALTARAYIKYAVLNEKGEEYYNHRLSIPIEKEDKEEDFKVDWDRMTSRSVDNFFVLDIIEYFYDYEYSNYQETLKSQGSYNVEDGSEYSGSGISNKDEIVFDKNGTLIEGEELYYVGTMTGSIATMQIKYEYNLKEFTGEEIGQGIIIELKKERQNGNPFWFININDVDKIELRCDKEEDKTQEIVQISDKEEIQQILNILQSQKFQYLSNEEYYEIIFNTKADLNILLSLKSGLDMDVIINEKGVFTDNQQGIISTKKSRDILELMEYIKK